MDDAALVLAAREGDKDAFASIYDRYADRLHTFLVTILRDHHEAADVLHDTFIDAGARLGQLRDPTKLRAWLFATARHNAFRRLRARSRAEPVAEVEVTATTGDPVEDASRAELEQLVASAAEGLSPRDRAMLDLHLRHGLEGQELGDVMGVTAGHAYVLLTRLRDQFERALGALLVARRGSRNCAELAALLEGWDGRFSPLLRKRVARHTDHCDVCAETKRRVLSPAELLGAMPLVPAPRQLRDHVLDNVDLVAHHGRPRLASRGGFPPPAMDPIRRARRAVLAATAVAMLVVGGTIWFGGDLEGAAGGGFAPDATPRVADEAPAGESTPEPEPTTAGRAGSGTPPPATGARSEGTADGSATEDEDDADVSSPEPTSTPRPAFTPRPTPTPRPTSTPMRRSTRP